MVAGASCSLLRHWELEAPATLKILLILDALLHILIVEVELADGVIGAVAGVVVGEDGLEGGFLFLGLDGVVLFFLRQVFLNLLHVFVALGRRGEDAGDIQRLEVGVGGLFLGLEGRKKGVVFDGVIDGGGGEQGIEAASAGGGIVLGEDGLDDGAFGEGFAGLGKLFALGLEVIDVEAQDVRVLDGVGDGVSVELLLEEVHGSPHGGLFVFDPLCGGVLLEDGRAGEAEELGLGEELFDGLVVLAELRAVALVEDEDDAFVAKRFQLFLVGGSAVLFLLLVALAVFIQREAELLDGGDDDLVGVVVGEKTADEGGGGGVFLDATFLELVELLAGLAVEVLAVHDEEAFLDVGLSLSRVEALKEVSLVARKSL